MTTQRIALVTGANKGIGFEIARQLAQAGVHVLIGARDDDRGRAAVADLARQGLAAQALRLDVTDGASIGAAALQIRHEHGRLDILVNNAGIFDPTDGPPGKASMSAVRRVFETNFFGALAVTQAMLPLFFVKTDLTGYGTMTPAEGAKLPVQHALAGEENGVFVEPGGSTPW